LRCQLAIFGSYRIDQFADPESFKLSLGAVLEQYPDEVITRVCDPRTGIQRRCKFPPTISEVVEALDDEANLAERRKRAVREPVPRAPERLLKDRPQGYLAGVFVPETHPRYEKLVEWAATAEAPYWRYGNASDGRSGIWVNIAVWEGTR
jgi:hypothetical protein